MNDAIKSMAYAMISKGFQIYLPEEANYFVANRIVCSNCNEPWYMNLPECFICGMQNPFLYRCENCGAFVSVTNAGKKCNNCHKENTLHLECPNPKCPTNTDKKLKNLINSKGGVFHEDSGFSIALQSCLKCGNSTHFYQVRKIAVFDFDKLLGEPICDDPENLLKLSFVIIRNNKSYLLRRPINFNFEKGSFPNIKESDIGKILEFIFDKKFDYY
jgi:hypothetical protein